MIYHMSVERYEDGIDRVPCCGLRADELTEEDAVLIPQGESLSCPAYLATLPESN